MLLILSLLLLLLSIQDSISELIDDYCDTGSDEPYSNACTTQQYKFRCINTGYISHDIPLSYVKDGICDCCDGSDEYNYDQQFTAATSIHIPYNQYYSNIQCSNTCRQHTQQAIQQLQYNIKQYIDSLKIMKSMVGAIPHVDQQIRYGLHQYRMQLDRLQPEYALLDYDSEPSYDDIQLYRTYAHLQAQYNYLMYIHTAKRNNNYTILGAHNVLLLYYQQCYNISQMQRRYGDLGAIDDYYTYIVCPLYNITQLYMNIDRITVNQTNVLGYWNGIIYNNTNGVYIDYMNGDQCYNGPKRSVNTTVQCGNTTQIIDIRENGLCEYTLLLESPIVCSVHVLNQMKQQYKSYVQLLSDLDGNT